jgi:bifunctional DNase/RNase
MDPRCQNRGCGGEPVFHFAQIAWRRVLSEKYFCEPHAREFLSTFRKSTINWKSPEHALGDAACVDFEMLVFHKGTEETPACIYLHEMGGTRRICLAVDGWAWFELVAEIKGGESPYPRTHGAWANTIDQLGGELSLVILDERKDGDKRLNASLKLVQGGELKVVGVRPSDAFTLAVIGGAPIFITATALSGAADQGGSDG